MQRTEVMRLGNFMAMETWSRLLAPGGFDLCFHGIYTLILWLYRDKLGSSLEFKNRQTSRTSNASKFIPAVCSSLHSMSCCQNLVR